MLMIGLGMALLLLMGAVCQPPASLPEAEAAQAGRWALEYTGACSGREAETIHISQLSVSQIVFDDFRLSLNDDDQYEGSADFIAPMPADGRDVIYTIAYSLRRSEDGGFVGTERVIEDGGHSLDCPIRLVFAPEQAHSTG